MQCHLETTSTRLPGMIRRFDRDPFSFVPGEPLKDYVLFFDHAPGSGREDKFEIVSSAYRLRRSQCFLKSPSMTCTTCHDPHGRSGAQSLVERNAAACKSCHKAALAELTTAGQHPPGPDCAGCHMPKRRTADAVHVVMTDHLIQRRPSPGDLLARLAERHPTQSEEYRGPVVPYYPPLPADALYNAVAQVLHGSNLTPGIPQLDAEIARRRPPEAEFYVTLGNAWQQIDRPDKAAAAFAEAVRLKPKSARELRYWGIALMQSGRSAAAAEAFKRAIAISPSDAVSWYQLGLIASGKGRSAEAVEKAAKAVSFDPDLLDAQNSLAVNLSALGDVGRAEAVFRSALRVNPYYATTHANLARLLAARGDLPPALMHFEEAIRFRADFAPDRYEYALALVQSNRFEEAAPQAEAAIQYDPKMVEARTLLGGLHARAGRLDDARIEYETALSLRPDHGRAHLDLARVLAAQGQLPQAIDHLRQAMKSLDPSSARQAAQALQRLQSLQK
jgi:predicted CXXCH cytochrome family protein